MPWHPRHPRHPRRRQAWTAYIKLYKKLMLSLCLCPIHLFIVHAYDPNFEWTLEETKIQSKMRKTQESNRIYEKPLEPGLKPKCMSSFFDVLPLQNEAKAWNTDNLVWLARPNRAVAAASWYDLACSNNYQTSTCRHWRLTAAGWYDVQTCRMCCLAKRCEFTSGRYGWAERLLSDNQSILKSFHLK